MQYSAQIHQLSGPGQKVKGSRTFDLGHVKTPSHGTKPPPTHDIFFIIDHEGGEIIHLVASVRLSVRQRSQACSRVKFRGQGQKLRLKFGVRVKCLVWSGRFQQKSPKLFIITSPWFLSVSVISCCFDRLGMSCFYCVLVGPDTQLQPLVVQTGPKMQALFLKPDINSSQCSETQKCMRQV